MLKLVLTRLAAMLAVLVAVSVLVFVLGSLIPGDLSTIIPMTKTGTEKIIRSKDRMSTSRRLLAWTAATTPAGRPIKVEKSRQSPVSSSDTGI